MTSQSRDTAVCVKVGKFTCIQPPENIQYDAVYCDSASEELKEHVKRLEGDVNFLRSMLIDIYDKCPKMKRGLSGNKKKVNKDDAVECENCGGLLW